MRVPIALFDIEQPQSAAVSQPVLAFMTGLLAAAAVAITLTSLSACVLANFPQTQLLDLLATLS
ncbi:MAG TPA: hypothetical protein VGH49_15735 [Xanthobacteraceae bacterium]